MDIQPRFSMVVTDLRLTYNLALFANEWQDNYGTQPE